MRIVFINLEVGSQHCLMGYNGRGELGDHEFQIDGSIEDDPETALQVIFLLVSW